MRIRQDPPGRGGREATSADRSHAHVGGPGHGEQDGAAWGDERQVAVWGQVSARTLYLVVFLNVTAGVVFDVIDSSRYGPCVLVFFAIALGATAYSGWVARRKGVDVRAPRAADRVQLVMSSLVYGVIFYAMVRFLAEGHNRHSWLAAAVAVGFGVGQQSPESWRRAPRAAGIAQLVVSSLVYGVILYAIAWSLAADRSFGSRSFAVPAIACAAIGYGFASRFFGAWDRRRALRSQEEAVGDALAPPDPIR